MNQSLQKSAWRGVTLQERTWWFRCVQPRNTRATPRGPSGRFCKVAAIVLAGVLLLTTTSLFAAEVPGDPDDNGGYLPEDSQFKPNPDNDPSVGNNPQPGFHDNGRGGNTFVNDPCIDPPPPSTRRTVQSETTIATYGNYMVAGFNDSFGFYDNTQGLSGFSYSLNGGNTWIDGGGLPPLVPSPTLFTTVGPDRYFGDPVTVVDKSFRFFVNDSSGNPLSQPIFQFGGTLYLVYVRFANDLIGSTPVELVRSFDGGRTWTAPTTVVPNEADAFNTGTYVLTVPNPAGGTRVLVFWWRRQFDLISGAVTN